MASLIKFLDFFSVIIFLASLVVGFTILRGLFFLIFKHNSDELKEFFNSLVDLAIKNMFLYTIGFILIIVITIITSREITFYLGLKDLSIIPNGTYTYYVEMTKVSSGKTYTEPAIIVKDSDCYEADEEHTKCFPVYYVERIYFANGGYITFDDENVVAIDTEMNVVDHKGNEYEVTLLNKHAYIKDVVESHPSTSQILEVVYLLLIELICWLIPVYLLSKKKEPK